MKSEMRDFHREIDDLDLRLFEAIESQSSEDDKRSLLLLERFIRSRRPKYAYLEIGSHLGGSIQPHLQDPCCISIVSIDPRPSTQPDERGPNCEYTANSTARMLANLREVSADGVEKITCFESDAREIAIDAIEAAPDLCFIDGQHTADAVVSDFKFCKAVSAAGAVIAFHDDWVIHGGLRTICAMLGDAQVKFTARKLPGSVFAIALDATSESLEFNEIGENGLRWLKVRAVENWAKERLPVGVQPLALKALHFVSRHR